MTDRIIKILNIINVISTVIIMIVIGIIAYIALEELREIKNKTEITEMAVMISDYYKKKGTPVSALEIRDIIRAVDKVLDEHPELPFTQEDLLAIAMVESNFNPRAVGRSGEVGQFQILNYKEILREIGAVGRNPKDPEVNTRMAVYVLKQKHIQYRDWEQAIKAYNGFGKTYWRKFIASKIVIIAMKDELGMI